MRTLYFCPVVSFYLLFFSSNLSGRRLDVYHTSTHNVALMRIRMQVSNVPQAAHWKYRTQKSPFWHNRTTLSGYIFGTKACIDNRKKLIKQQYLLHDNMVNFGLLTAEICWRVRGTPANFNGFRVLAALLHGTQVVGVSQTLRR